jgi:hypothetical protein
MKDFIDKIITLAGQFLSKWFSGTTDEVSSRRATSFVALMLLVIMVLWHTMGLVPINTEIFITTAALCAGALGFTLYDSKRPR